METQNLQFILKLLFSLSLGAVIGSFLNVLIERLPKGKNPWFGRSRCDYCRHKLTVFDLIPLLSYIYLGGRCRNCKKKLSLQYPILELTSGLMYIWIFVNVQNNLSILQKPTLTTASYLLLFISLCLIFSSLLVMFVTDIKYFILPDLMQITTLIGVCMYLLFQYISAKQVYFGQRLFFSIILSISFLLIHKLTKGKGMGLGDVKLVFIIGLFLGFPLGLIAVYLAFLTGAIVSLILIFNRRKKLKDKIAFGPFLIAGCVFSYVYSENILNWFKYLI